MVKNIKDKILERKIEIEKLAFERWTERNSVRTNPKKFFEQNQYEKAKIDKRYDNFNSREKLLSKVEKNKYSSETTTTERKVGDTWDLSKYPLSEEQRKFGVPVGRIYQLPEAGYSKDAFATGFLISPNLLITNNHVFPEIDYAEGCVINFFHEYKENRIKEGIEFTLQPEKFFLTDEKLDFTIVYVSERDISNKISIESIGFLPLITTKGKVILKSPINIVQHPNGGVKQYSTINNIVVDILEEKGFIHYTTDTDEASSGSPAGNEHWEVAALHRAGIAMTVNNQVWSKYDKPWDKDTMTDEDKIYIANEGVSISRIVEHLQSIEPENDTHKEIIEKIIENGKLSDMSGQLNHETERKNNEKTLTNTDNKMGNIFNFHNSNVNIYTSYKDESIELQNTEKSLGTLQIAEKKLRFDENYAARKYKGYKENFLSVNIPTPSIKEDRLKEIYTLEDNQTPLLLKYYHFSVVMNKQFRLMMWSAVNIDYDPALKSSRGRNEFGDEGNSWRPDPRIPTEFQITNEEFYKPATKVDRGHIVRRDDSCYGNTELEIEYANSDTFHWTNCTPQHEGFNQSKRYGKWGQLENSIKDGLSGSDTKASVFSGPILVKDEARKYNNIYYPTQFWKVVAAIDDKLGLMAYGFILDQSKVIDNLGLEAKFDFSQFKYQQVKLSEIEKSAGINFPEVLLQSDVFVKKNISDSDIKDINNDSDLII